MDFLTDIDLSELTTTGVLTLAVLVFTVVGFIRGAVKLVFMLFSLAGAVVAAHWGSEVFFLRIQEGWVTVPIWLADALALGCAVLAFVILMKVFSFFIDPFETSNFVGQFVFGIPAAIISLVAAVVLVWATMVFLYDKGAKSEIRYWMAQDDHIEEVPEEETAIDVALESLEEPVAAKPTNYTTVAKLKQQFEVSIIGQAALGIYQINASEEHHLAKLLVMEKTAPAKFTSFAENESITGLYTNATLEDLRANETVATLIANNDCKGLLKFFKRERVLLNLDLKNALSKIKEGDLK